MVRQLRSSLQKTFARALVPWLVMGLGLASCEKLVGIHDVGKRNGGAGGAAGHGNGGQGGQAGAETPRGGRGGTGQAGAGGMVMTDAGGTAGAMGGADGLNDAGQNDTGKSGNGGATVVDGGGGVGGSTQDGGTDAADAAPKKCLPSEVFDGTAYHFGPPPRDLSSDNMGLCSYPNAQLPPGRFYGAIDKRVWSGAGACGRCLEVSNASNASSPKVEMQIINVIMTEPSDGSFSLSLEDQALSLLGSKDGNPSVKFKYVPCSEPGDIKVSFVAVAPNPPRVLVMSHRLGLKLVELKIGTPTNWIAMTRPDHNVWELPSGAMNLSVSSPISLRLTDEVGDEIVASVPFSQTWTDIGTQFPAPACTP